jgi:dTDP-4-dehydrorhamnose reductase
MVGRAVVKHCSAQNDEVLAHNHSSLDITNAEAINKVFERERPDTVINCAAWTDVDGCESDPARAMAVNAEAVEALAVESRRMGASFVTISTDYVFDGKKEGFYTQRDDPAPQSVYGKAKLRGERRAQAATARCIVVRTGWIFGVGGKNFLATVAERARRGERLKAINDAWGTPTYATHLAARLRELAWRDLPGIYHVVNDGTGTSFEGFARLAANLAGCESVEIESVSIDSLARPAERPRNSRLRCLLSDAIGLDPLPDWKSALSIFVAQTLA